MKYIIITLSYLSVLGPVWMGAKDLSWGLNSTLTANLFPLFGLAGFAMLWLHMVGAGLEPWLRKYIDFKKFVNNTSTIILILIVLHPLLLLVSFGFNVSAVFQNYSFLYLLLGIIGWLLLLTYDIGRALKRRDFFVRHWNKILLISTIGFIFTFFHSLGLGTDLQEGPLRVVWIFYGVTAILSTIYTYGIKRFI